MHEIITELLTGIVGESMKIAYLIHWNEGPESGVFKKICSQVNEWMKLGNEVRLFIYTSRKTNDWDLHCGQIEIVIQQYEGWRNRFSLFRNLVDLTEQWKPDIIYHRFDLYYPYLDRLLRKHPSVLEINSNDLAEMRLRPGVRYWYHLLTRTRVLKVSQGFVFVSKELSEEKHYSRYAKSKIVIGNGVELDKFPPAAVPQNEQIRLVFIGSPRQSWHGTDKIVWLAKHQPSWTFDMIGIDRLQMVEDVIPINMTFHGKLTKDQYQPIMQQADVAIGSLAMHRAMMKEASPLKVREYLAYGIPVILGYRDTDFPDNNTPFILELPNESNNIETNMDKIKNFSIYWAGKRVKREWVQHLDTKQKEANRIAYMKSICWKR
jgi:glycosyltransferase involved in cell wall biosynthesis